MGDVFEKEYSADRYQDKIGVYLAYLYTSHYTGNGTYDRENPTPSFRKLLPNIISSEDITEYNAFFERCDDIKLMNNFNAIGNAMKEVCDRGPLEAGVIEGVILFLFASIAFLILDIQKGLYLSDRFCHAVALLLIFFFGFFGKTNTMKGKILRYLAICAGILILGSIILLGSSSEMKYGSQNVIPCKIAEHKLATQMSKAVLIESKAGRERYLIKSAVTTSEITSIVKEKIGPSVVIEYSKIFHRYTLKKNNQEIGSVQFTPSREFYNMDYFK